MGDRGSRSAGTCGVTLSEELPAWASLRPGEEGGEGLGEASDLPLLPWLQEHLQRLLSACCAPGPVTPTAAPCARCQQHGQGEFSQSQQQTGQPGFGARCPLSACSRLPALRVGCSLRLCDRLPKLPKQQHPSSPLSAGDAGQSGHTHEDKTEPRAVRLGWGQPAGAERVWGSAGLNPGARGAAGVPGGEAPHLPALCRTHSCLATGSQGFTPPHNLRSDSLSSRLCGESSVSGFDTEDTSQQRDIPEN